MGGEGEVGFKSDSFDARDRKQTGYGGDDQGNIGTTADKQTGVSTGEACAGDDDEDNNQEANPGRKASSPSLDNMDANEEMNSISPGADEGHAEDEESALPDVVVTANFVGKLRKGGRYRRKRWKLELEGGAIETSESVFVFDKCECTFVSPWEH